VIATATGTRIATVEREDLGAQFARVTRVLIDAERPLLDARELSMWGYIVLSALATGDADTQLALSERIGYDKTRLIGLLDQLQLQGLVEREPDPADRRARRVRLTAAGRARYKAAREDVHAMEDALLARLDDAERRALHSALASLSSRGRRESSGTG